MRLFLKEIIIPYHVTFSQIEQADFVASPVSSDIQVPMHDGRKYGIQNTGFILLHIQFFPFRNFSFEFLFNGVVFIQYWIKMIAKVMGCNMRTAQSRVRNALKIMRKEQENER